VNTPRALSQTIATQRADGCRSDSRRTYVLLRSTSRGVSTMARMYIGVVEANRSLVSSTMLYCAAIQENVDRCVSSSVYVIYVTVACHSTVYMEMYKRNMYPITQHTSNTYLVPHAPLYTPICSPIYIYIYIYIRIHIYTYVGRVSAGRTRLGEQHRQVGWRASTYT
jgi:hypothetical protein